MINESPFLIHTETSELITKSRKTKSNDHVPSDVYMDVCVHVAGKCKVHHVHVMVIISTSSPPPHTFFLQNTYLGTFTEQSAMH